MRRLLLYSLLVCSLLLWAAGCDGLYQGSFDDGGGRTPDLGPRPAPSCGMLATCGLHCARLDNDPANCGACDRTCVIPNAAPGCVSGQCVVAACLDGYFDVNHDVADGCETQSNCVAGSACTTACDTVGVTTCVEATAACTPLAETCNGKDDNCDGRCDEAIANCRIPVHRATGLGAHYYTTDLAAAKSPPYSIEFANYFFIYPVEVNASRPVYLCPKGGGKFFLTSSTSCEGLNVAGKLLGYWLPGPRCDAKALYRMYNGAANDHFYTVSDAERQIATAQYGYQLEGIVGYVFVTP